MGSSTGIASLRFPFVATRSKRAQRLTRAVLRAIAVVVLGTVPLVGATLVLAGSKITPESGTDGLPARNGAKLDRGANDSGAGMPPPPPPPMLSPGDPTFQLLIPKYPPVADCRTLRGRAEKSDSSYWRQLYRDNCVLN